MRPIYENIPSTDKSSIHSHKATNQYVDIPWHYHPEIEITHIHRGKGTRYIGTSIGRFNPGEVTLIGPNIPHLWINDKEYYVKSSNLEHEDWVIQFRDNLWGDKFLELPEMLKIKKMILRSQRGIVFKVGELEITKFLNIFDKMIKSPPFQRIPLLIEILGIMADNPNWEYLNSKTYIESDIKDSERMQKIFNYVTDNYKSKISLKAVSELISLSPSGFCRYFKRINGKPFFDYVNNVRIEHACKLLLEDDILVTSVCYQSGYNNFSNFSRHFKKITGYSPLKYRRVMQFENK